MTPGYSIIVLAPVAGLAVHIFVHVISSRVLHGRSQMKCFLIGFILGLTTVFSLAATSYSAKDGGLDFIGYLLTDLIAYGALVYCYFHFVNIYAVSLRIRILQALIDSPQGLSEEGLRMRYNAEQIAFVRINRLVSSNQLIEKQSLYFLGKNRTFLVLFWLFEILKYIALGRGNRLLQIKSSE